MCFSVHRIFLLCIANFPFEDPDFKVLMADWNIGQRCLLKGLVYAANSSQQLPVDDSSFSYLPSVSKTNESLGKVQNLRQTLGKLFSSRSRPSIPSSYVNAFPLEGQSSSGTSSSSTNASKKRAFSTNDEVETFEYKHNNFVSRKGKGGKCPFKTGIKKKIKEIRMKVIGLESDLKTTPTGIDRESMLKTVWVRESAHALETEEKLRSVLGGSLIASCSICMQVGVI